MGLPRAVIEILEAHLVGLLVHQEDAVGIQVGVHDVFRVEDLDEVDDLDSDVNGFEL